MVVSEVFAATIVRASDMVHYFSNKAKYITNVNGITVEFLIKIVEISREVGFAKSAPIGDACNQYFQSLVHLHIYEQYLYIMQRLITLNYCLAISIIWPLSTTLDYHLHKKKH